jgi:hypothetical protein
LAALNCNTLTVPSPTAMPTPTARPTATATVLPTPTPPGAGQLTLAVTNTFTDTSGNYHLVGEVRNNTDQALTAIEIAVELADSAGNSVLMDDDNAIVEQVTVSPLLYTLAPGETSPFEYTLVHSWGGVTRGTPAAYKATLAGQQTGRVNRARLRVEHIHIIDSGVGRLYLNGELVNTENRWVRVHALAGAVVNADRVLSANATLTYAGELAPAGDAQERDRTPFGLVLSSPGLGATLPTFYWDADIADDVTDDSLSLAVTNTYVDQDGVLHMVGLLTNESERRRDVRLVGGLYAADGAVLSAGYGLWGPIPVDPGAPIPFDVTRFANADTGEPAASFASYRLVVDRYAERFKRYLGSIYTATAASVELPVTDEQPSKVGATWSFFGHALNDSGQPLGYAVLFLSVYDANGGLVATTDLRWGDISTGVLTPFPPGKKLEYIATVRLDPNADASEYRTVTTVIGQVE